ncbi:hypothetical protein Dimus_013534 [Dionaea muscipula]
MDGDARMLVEAGPASFDRAELPFQVASSISSLLPLKEPIVSSCFDSSVGMEEKGEGVECSVQGSPLAVQAGVCAEDSGVSIFQLLVNEGGQVHELQQGFPQQAISGQKLVIDGLGKGLGSVMANAVLDDLANPLAQAASKWSGNRGGSGFSYASAAPPSPGLRRHHRRSPPPMPLSSPDPGESSSTEDGEATAGATSTSEDEDHSDYEGGM